MHTANSLMERSTDVVFNDPRIHAYRPDQFITANYATRAGRPNYSLFHCATTRAQLNLSANHWCLALRQRRAYSGCSTG